MSDQGNFIAIYQIKKLVRALSFASFPVAERETDAGVGACLGQAFLYEIEKPPRTFSTARGKP
ncbi:uncharacterized protein METZ01_LOCUS228622, partial [marine metagenome]